MDQLLRCCALVALAVLILTAPAAATQVQLGPTDTFNGTNGNTLSTYSANWSNPDAADYNECTITGSPGVGSTFGLEYNTSQTWTNDQWAELTVDGTTLADQHLQVTLRVQTGGTFSGYAVGPNAGQIGTQAYQIERYDSNVRTQLASSGTLMAVNDVINAQIVGTVITLTVNGVAVLTYDTSGDATKYSAGNVGLRLQHTAAVRLGGTWRAGSVTSGVTPSAPQRLLLGVGQ